MSLHWPRLIVGLFVVFALFQWTATLFESDRGQGPAILHFVIQSTVKVVVVPDLRSRLGARRPIGWDLK